MVIKLSTIHASVIYTDSLNSLNSLEFPFPGEGYSMNLRLLLQLQPHGGVGELFVARRILPQELRVRQLVQDVVHRLVLALHRSLIIHRINNVKFFTQLLTRLFLFTEQGILFFLHNLIYESEICYSLNKIRLGFFILL